MGGGGAQSQNWNRIRADVLGLPVAVPAVTESALLGAAILAAVATGFCRDICEAVSRMVRIRCQIEPEASAHQAYTGLFEIYRGLAGDLRGRFDALDQWQRHQAGRKWQPHQKCEP